MTDEPDQRELERAHTDTAIEARIEDDGNGWNLRDAMLGGIDGGVTTFAVISGAIGGGFPNVVIVALGLASLAADGFSMGVSNYLGVLSDRERREKLRREEAMHIRRVPEREREEVRRIFARKGLEPAVVDDVVDTITDDRERWIRTMLREEHGLAQTASHPLRAAVATLGAFWLVGIVPLLLFLVPGLDRATRFAGAAILTGVSFLALGLWKGRVLGTSAWRSGLQTLAMGSAAAALAYGIGRGIRYAYGVG